MTVQARLPSKQVRKSGKQMSIYHALGESEPKPRKPTEPRARDVRPPSLLHGLEREIYDLLKVMLRTGPAIARTYSTPWIAQQLGADETEVAEALLILRHKHCILSDDDGEPFYWRAQRC